MNTQDPREAVLTLVGKIMNEHPDLAMKIEGMAQEAQKKSAFDADLLWAVNADLLAKSRSQLRQDVFVLAELGYKRNGFFVEFGATNGVELSNSHLLEKEFGWSGVLAEPARMWHADLHRNRSARIDTRCVWSRSNETLMFNETNVGEFSTIDQYSTTDMHAKSREDGKRYEVETVSLMDLLEAHGAPREIDYLSIDTEGSEFQILEAFDFSKYDIKVITCEHNFTPMREQIHALLSRNGFVRKHEKLSQFDDWYVKAPPGAAKAPGPARSAWSSAIPGMSSFRGIV